MVVKVHGQLFVGLVECIPTEWYTTDWVFVLLYFMHVVMLLCMLVMTLTLIFMGFDIA